MPTEDDLPLRAGEAPAAAAAATSRTAPETGEEAAWTELAARWGDDAAHRAYLDRFTDLDGLALAGRRYREVLAARPGDPVAARWRDEVVKRAMVHGIAALPRTRPEQEFRRTRRALLVAAALVSGATLATLIWRLVEAAR